MSKNRRVQDKIMMILEERGERGATVKELRVLYDMGHHGTVSGVLSYLNKKGLIDLLEEKEDGCHLYVLPQFRMGRDIYVRAQSPAVLRLLRKAREEAWKEGALWAAVECGAIDTEKEVWLAPGDNPYSEENL